MRGELLESDRFQFCRKRCGFGQMFTERPFKLHHALRMKPRQRNGCEYFGYRTDLENCSRVRRITGHLTQATETQEVYFSIFAQADYESGVCALLNIAVASF